MGSGEPIKYKDGTVDVPHLGITLRSLFAAAANEHDIELRGRKVRVTTRGVYIGTIQLADDRKKGKR
jgi:hypothetical protein